MSEHKADIAIYGAGIAGLWLFHKLKRRGYDAVLLEKDKIGGGQSIASQGIIHSGLKYTLAGKVSELARSISAMPDIWRDAISGKGDVDLSAAKINAGSQQLLIPGGFVGGVVKTLATKALGNGAHEIPQDNWPRDLPGSGFTGSLIHMSEPVLNIPSVIRALAAPYQDFIRRPDGAKIKAKLHIYTAAAGNMEAAQANGESAGLETQARPLLMGLLKPAPFPLYAHLVGKSEKPVCTITTHQCADGTLVWYLGAGVAERPKEDDPEHVYADALKAFHTYFPQIDFSGMQWAALPIDRIEGKSKTAGFMPDAPTIHEAGNHLYCWPTKLTFAPLLTRRITDKINARGIMPSQPKSDWSALPFPEYANPPWENAKWKSYRGAY